MNSAAAPAESCDFCRAALTEAHQHLIEPSTRRLECVCDACAILFSGQKQKYRRIPRRLRFLPEFRMTDEQWDGMMIPIGIAFLFRQSASGKMTAVYPSPAGPVESLLPLEAWRISRTIIPKFARWRPTSRACSYIASARLVNTTSFQSMNVSNSLESSE
jgi:hypothetical protein